MKTNNRDEEIKLIKHLIAGDQVLCPKCNKSELEPFHKKAKKSNTDWICKACGERYQVIKMMAEI